MKVVQELLGHSDFSLTADTYSHVSEELAVETVRKLNGLLKTNKVPTQNEDKSK